LLLCCSAYSNSFVNLAIFKPDVERSKVADIIGKEAEELTHLFCVVSTPLPLRNGAFHGQLCFAVVSSRAGCACS
jgi:hypothetical protein